MISNSSLCRLARTVGRRGWSAAAAALLAGAAFPQSPDRLGFEVASIKKSLDPQQIGVRLMPGGRLIANAPVKLLVMYAYGLQRSQIVSEPDWVNIDRYAIEAKAGSNVGKDRLMLMLQSLLTDRFQLKSHREVRQIRAYVLAIGRNGPTLTQSDDSGCAAVGATRASSPSIGAQTCGEVRISPTGAGVRMEGHGVPVSELVRALAVVLNEPIIDATGLPGRFDIRLEFVDDVPGAAPSGATGATLRNAIQEQLGLKLESARSPVDFLVIEHIERPTEN